MHLAIFLLFTRCQSWYIKLLGFEPGFYFPQSYTFLKISKDDILIMRNAFKMSTKIRGAKSGRYVFQDGANFFGHAQIRTETVSTALQLCAIRPVLLPQ